MGKGLGRLFRTFLRASARTVISEVLRLSTDFILFGRENAESSSPITQLLRSCSPSELAYAEQLLKTFIMAMNAKKESL